MTKTIYEKWMEKIILKETGQSKISIEVLRLYQLSEIKKTISTAKKSNYYKNTLKNIESDDINNFDDFKKVPFTTSEDLARNPKSFLCTGLDKIARIVTINTSGTTGMSKRVFFTENDLKATIEFFKYGMLNIVSLGQRVLILMPGSAPSSIGQLLQKSLSEAGCEGLIYGPIFDVWDALETIKEKKIDCIVGLPIQVYYLAKLKDIKLEYRNFHLNSILLSADYVPRAISDEVSKVFNCPVFTHYGMSEMGYGGGVECAALNGYHMRDVDLYVEIINPLTGENVAEGDYGEVVFTTLKREGMPLIRYKTGDISRFLPNDCSCNKTFKRLDYVIGRLSESLIIDDENFISIGMLDEVMFQIDNLLDYKVEIEKDEVVKINLIIKLVNREITIKLADIKNIFMEDKCFGALIKDGKIIINLIGTYEEVEVSNGMQKRKFCVAN